MLQADPDKDKNYKFDITKICLYAPVIRVTDSLQPYLGTLCETAPARYFFQSNDLKLFNIAKDTDIYEVARLYTGRLPTRLIIAFHTSTSISGSVTESPFFTSSTVKIRSVKLSHDGIVLHQITPNFDTKSYSMMYHNFVNFVPGGVGNEAFMIKFQDFHKGHRFVFIYVLRCIYLYIL